MMEPTYTLEGLRGVGRVELTLRHDQRAYVFFGSNGVGKTKCLEGLFQYYWINHKESIKRPLSSDTHILSHGNFTYHRESLLVAEKSYGAIEKEHNLPIVFLGAGKRGHIDAGPICSEPLGVFESRRGAYIQKVINTMKENFSNLGMSMGLEEWFVSIAHTANRFQKLEDNREIEINILLQLLNKIDSRFDPAGIKINADNHIYLKIDGIETDIRNLSTGFLSLLKIFQTIISGYGFLTNETKLDEVKGLVFIDEIESHLHTSWQSKIIPLLKKLFPNTTFFIATHSPIVLSQLEEGEAYRLEKQVDGVVRASVIEAPNRRILDEVLDDAMGVNLNALKKKRLEQEDQSELKQKLQKLLDKSRGKN